MRTYFVLMSAFAVASTLVAQEVLDFDVLLDRLVQPGNCVSAEVSLESLANGGRRYRELLSKRLPILLESTPSVDAKRCVAELAGNLRLQSTIKPIGALLENYRTIPVESGIYRDMQLVGDPFADALVKMNALTELSVHLQSPKVSARSRAARALMKIGSSEARHHLAAHLPGESDLNTRSMIKAYLDT